MAVVWQNQTNINLSMIIWLEAYSGVLLFEILNLCHWNLFVI